MQEPQLTEAIPLILTSALWGQYCFLILSPLRAHQLTMLAVDAITGDYDIICLLIRQAIFHFSVPPLGLKFDQYLGDI